MSDWPKGWAPNETAEWFDAEVAAPSPALTREALVTLLHGKHQTPDPQKRGFDYDFDCETLADAILTALSTPPPAPTSTREETP